MAHKLEEKKIDPLGMVYIPFLFKKVIGGLRNFD